MDKQVIQEEVDKNYEVFKELLPTLMKNKYGKFALMRHGKVISCFDTNNDALLAASLLYEDGIYSVQKVETHVVDIMYYSCA